MRPIANSFADVDDGATCPPDAARPHAPSNFPKWRRLHVQAEMDKTKALVVKMWKLGTDAMISLVTEMAKLIAESEEAFAFDKVLRECNDIPRGELLKMTKSDEAKRLLAHWKIFKAIFDFPKEFAACAG
eukprot:2311960-Pyramimonas_sp.AAC.1